MNAADNGASSESSPGSLISSATTNPSGFVGPAVASGDFPTPHAAARGEDLRTDPAPGQDGAGVYCGRGEGGRCGV